MADLSDLQTAVINGIRRYFDVEQPSPEATVLLREVARNMVEARAQFTQSDGTPDWKGRSGDYRKWFGEALSEAGVEDRHGLQSALRYHTGLLLRERLRAEELVEFGFTDRSPRDQINDRRADMARVYALVTGNAPIRTAADRKRAAEIIRNLTARQGKTSKKS